MASRNWPPSAEDASNSVTSWPRSAADTAVARPAGPPPTTATRLRVRVGESTSVVSWQARGFTRHEARLLANVWSRHAWLQPMQVLISSARPAAALATKSGSARNGRAIDTRSAPPVARISSATSGVLMRLDAQTGIPTSGRSRAVVEAQAARGTCVRIVGTRASCQPMPVLITEAPAVSTALREGDRLVPGLAVGHEVEQRHAVHHQEVVAERLADPADDLDREAHPVLRRAAPPVGAAVGVRGEELVDQVALGAHHLDAVVARAPGEPGGVDEVADGALDAAAAQRARLERRDR